MVINRDFSGEVTATIYRDEINSLQIQLSRTQAGPGRAVKEQQEQNSPNHIQRINLISVQPLPACHAAVQAAFSQASVKVTMGVGSAADGKGRRSGVRISALPESCILYRGSAS